MCFCSPHSDVSSSDGDLSADGIHRYHCECGRDEMHEGGGQQPIHQEQDRHLWWESVPALRWDSNPDWTHYIVHVGWVKIEFSNENIIISFYNGHLHWIGLKWSHQEAY